jgi:AcrR family transcriptional regulator
MPRAGLSPDAVTDAALAQVDAAGPESLTLAAVAERTGVATPSLYKHVGSLAELRRRVALRVLDEMTGRLAEAVLGRSRDDALRAAMLAYREYVREHPHRYRALPQTRQTSPELAAASDRMLGVVLAVLRGYGLDEAPAIHAARCFRAAAHGFASLESLGGFQLAEDVDESYDLLISMVAGGLAGARPVG